MVRRPGDKDGIPALLLSQFRFFGGWRRKPMAKAGCLGGSPATEEPSNLNVKATIPNSLLRPPVKPSQTQSNHKKRFDPKKHDLSRELFTMSAKTYSPVRLMCSAARAKAHFPGGEPGDNFFPKKACNHHIWGYTASHSTKCGRWAAACRRWLSRVLWWELPVVKAVRIYCWNEQLT